MASSVNLGSVHLSLELRLQKMRDGLRDAKRDLSGFEKSLNQLAANTRRIGQSMSLSITAPLLLLGKQALKTAADMDALERGMAGVMGSSQAAAKEIAKLREVAKLPGLGMEDAVRGSLRLQGMGTSADEARRILLAFGNAVARMGGGMAELDGVTRALGQTLAKGKISMEEVLQLAERQIPVFQAMKDIWGTADTELLTKMGVSATEFVSKLTTFFGAQEKVGDSAKNKIENLGQAWNQFLEKVGKALLEGGLSKAMDGFIKRLDSATNWFSRLDPAAQKTFTNMTIALAVGGPLLVGLSALITSLTTINAALLTMARNPLIMALLAAGAGTAFFAGGGGDAIERGMNRWLDNLKASLGIEGPKLPTPTVGPFAKRPAMVNPLGEVMKPNAGGFLEIKDFFPNLKRFESKQKKPTGRPLLPTLTEEEKRRAKFQKEYAADVDIEVLKATPGRQFTADLRAAEKAYRDDIARGAKRADAEKVLAAKIKEIWTQYYEWKAGREDKLRTKERIVADEAWETAIRKRRAAEEALANVSAGIGGFRNLKTPDFGIKERVLKTLDAEALPEALSKAIQEALDKAAKPDVVSPSTREVIAKNLIDPEAIAAQLKKATEMTKGQKIAAGFGKDLGSNLAYEMGYEFSKAFDKVFGVGNPLSRALNRTFTRLLDDLLYNAFSSGFGGKGLEGLFGGGIAQGGIDPMTGNPRQGGMGGMGTIGGILGLISLFAGGGIFKGIGKALSGIFRADGGPVRAGMPYIVGERGPELFVPRHAGTVVAGGAGGINITIPGLVIREEADLDRLAMRIRREMKSRAGSG